MWKDFLSFSKSEQRGILALFILIVIVLSLNLYFKTRKPASTLNTQKLDALIAKMNANRIVEEKKLNPDTTTLFHFNPNKTSKEAWQKLGFDNWQIKIISNYLNKGGHFYEKSDLKKIYGISDSQYNAIKSFITIPLQKRYHANQIEEQTKYKKKENPATNSIDSSHQADNQNDKKAIDTLPQLDINSITHTELHKKTGLSRYMSERIIKYRNLLGGFSNKKQFYDVYGIDNNQLSLLNKCTFIDSDKINKININFSNFKELYRHPYINYEMAGNILDYRSENGPFNSYQEMIENKLIPDSLSQDLEPYISF